MVRAQHAPFDLIEPQRGKVSEYNIKPPRSEHWGVLGKNNGGLNLTNGAGHFVPKSRPAAADAFTFSGCADVLAGKPARNHVNNSAPWSSVKRADIIPNWERLEASVVLSCEKYASGVFVVFDCTDCSPAEQLSAEYSATSARE